MRRVVIAATVAAMVTSAVITVAATAQINQSGTGDPPAATAARSGTPSVASDIMAARFATAKYATSLSRAKAAGYGIITKMIPNMGYHFMNPKVTGFDVRRPPILVYEHHRSTWQLGALEWVFTSTPAKPPLPGAKYGVFGAACHYVDGTFVFQNDQSKCAPKSPRPVPSSTSGTPV